MCNRLTTFEEGNTMKGLVFMNLHGSFHTSLLHSQSKYLTPYETKNPLQLRETDLFSSYPERYSYTGGEGRGGWCGSWTVGDNAGAAMVKRRPFWCAALIINATSFAAISAASWFLKIVKHKQLLQCCYISLDAVMIDKISCFGTNWPVFGVVSARCWWPMP